MAAGQNTLYAHDPDGQVTAVFDGSGAGSKISYDADGNIASVTSLPASTLAVAQVSPESAAPGSTVDIYGTDFGSSASGVQVTIGGAAAGVSSVNPNEIIATVPSGASGSGVSVTVSGTTATSDSFTVPSVAPVPTITSLGEQVGDPGGSMTISGSGFGTDPALDLATINGVKVGVTSATATQLQVALPPVPVSGPVTVVTPGGSATSSSDIITAPQPYMAANVGWAGELANATQTPITISAQNQIALALFTVPAGQRGQVKISASIPDPNDPNQYSMSVFGPDGRTLVPFAKVTSASKTVSLPDGTPPGLYELELVPVNGDTGSFQVTATDMTDPTAAMTIGGGFVSVTTTTGGQHPRWTFTGTAGQRVYLQWSPGCGVCTVRLLNPDGSTLAFDEEDDNYLTATLPSSGTYTLTMDGASATTWSAKVGSISGDATGTATVNGSAATLNITARGQDGDASFAGTAGEKVFTQIALNPAPDGGGVTLLGPDGSIVSQATQTTLASGQATAVFDTVTLPATGTYHVRLTQLTHLDSNEEDIGYTGAATVTVTTPQDATATATVDGPAVPVNITTPGQHGVVSFTGSSGEKVYTALTMSPTMSVTGSVKIIDTSDGKTLGSNTFTGDNGFLNTVTLPEDGTYEAVVDPVGTTAAYTGTITVALDSAPDQTANTAVDGGPVTISLAKPGEEAVATFPLTAGENVFTQISFSPAPTRCGKAGIFDPVLQDDANTSGCLNSPPVFIDDTQLTGNQSYDVVVDPSGGYTGAVTITVSSVPAAATATTTWGGPPVNVTTAAPGQDAKVMFTGVPTGMKGQISIPSSTFPAPPTGDLFGPGGSDILPSLALSAGSTFDTTGKLGSAGTYTLTITHSGPGTGTIGAGFGPVPAGAAQRPPASRQPRQPAPSHPQQAAKRGRPVWSYHVVSYPKAHASLSGTILTTAGRPLPGVTVSVAGRSGRTGTDGRFRLTGLPQGLQVLQMNGTTASTSSQSFGVFEAQVRLRAGANQLPFTSYFPVLDTHHEVHVSEPLAASVTLTTPAIPGLEVHVPKGAVITDAAGRPVHELGITAIPVKRTPIPMPVDEQVPVYFTVQPAGGQITHGWATIDYPNYHHAVPKTPIDFWHYDVHGTGWGIYGSGSVDSAGAQVVPGKDTWVTDFNGAMITEPNAPAPNNSWLGKFLNFAGDPVDPSTGLFHMTHTDLTVNDVIPLTLTRGYNSGDGNPRPFGNNSNDLYDTFLSDPAPGTYSAADLNLVDGMQVHFTRITPGTAFETAVMRAQTTIPEFFGALMSWNGSGWNVTLRSGMTLVYGEVSPLQEIRDAHGNTVQIFRLYQNTFGDSTGPITNVVSPNGYWLAYNWDTKANPARITKVTDNAGQSVSYSYDSNGNLHIVTDPDQHPTTYGYDSSNRMNSITDGNNVQYLTQKYQSGKVSTQTIAGVGTYGFTYTNQGSGQEAVAISEPDGTTRNLTFNNGYLATDQRATGTSSSHTITISPSSQAATAGLAGSVSDGDGRSISTTYDDNGNELQNTFTAGGNSISASAQYKGAPFGLPASVTNPDGNAEAFKYDAGGDLTSVKDPLGNTGTSKYNGDGTPQLVQSPLGNKSTYNYTNGSLTSATDPLGRTSHYVYDSSGRLVEMISPDGTTTHTTYDADNQVTSTTDANGFTTHYFYDNAGNLTKVVDPLGNPTQYFYNNADQLTETKDALGNSDSTTYGPTGTPASYIDRNGKETDYKYDPLGRISFIGYGKRSDGTYDSSLTYGYDPNTGNLTSVADTTPGAGTITYTYDSFDHVKAEKGPGGTISYSYNAAGQLESMTPPGQSQITYKYDADGRLKEEDQGTQSATFGYDADGRLQTETLPDGITATYGYDADAELQSITYQEGSTTVGNVTYGYDANGNRISEGGSLVNTVLPAPTKNTYNADNELATVNGSPYAYDNNGNLLSDGTNAYTWNDRNQLTGVSGPSGTSSLGYDPLGRLLSTAVGGVTTTFGYDGSSLVNETGTNGANASFLQGPYGPLSMTDNSTSGGGAVSTFLPDALNSTLALANPSGQLTTTYSYNLFGAATSSAGASDPNPLRYTGLVSGPVMPAGLQNNNARDYSPTLGQFISPDPSGASGSGTNLYQYADSDPVDNSDPSGLQWQLLIACGVGAAANDIGGALDGRKNSVGDFFIGGLLGCFNGALMLIPGADEAELALEAGDGTLAGVDGGEDVAALDDGLSGDGEGMYCGGQGGESFAPSTMIRLADGRTVAISKLKPGDRVLATDVRTGKTTGEPVTAIWVHRDENLYNLRIEAGGQPEVANAVHSIAVIHTTSNHLFWNPAARKWVKAAELKAGDPLKTPDGQLVAAVGGYTPKTDTGWMWDLTVPGGNAHDFYVSTVVGSILVHNLPDAYVPPPDSKILPGFPNARFIGSRGGRATWLDGKYTLQWDYQHGAVEMYNRRGIHLGEFDPNTGEQIKPGVPGRTPRGC